MSGTNSMEREVGRLESKRAELAAQMGDEAFRAMFLDPCKRTPDLDAAVARYLEATEPSATYCKHGIPVGRCARCDMPNAKLSRQGGADDE